MKFVVLEKGKRVHVSASARRKAYYRWDPRGKSEPQKPVKVENGSSEEFMSKMAQMVKQSRKNDWKYACMEDFVLQNGRKFEYVMSNVRKGRMKECFRNAYRLASSNPDLTYVEGFAVSGNLPLPLFHAWCVDKNGVVYDPTWENGKSYFGVPFGQKFVDKTIVVRKKFGIIDNWEQGWPLVSGKEDETVWKV